MIFYLVTIYHERQFQIMFTIDELKPLGFQATFWMERLLCDLQGDDDSWSFLKFQPGFTIVVSNIIEGEDLLFQRCNGKIYWIWFSKLYWRRVIIKQKLEEENKNKNFLPIFSEFKKKVFFTFFFRRGPSEKWVLIGGPMARRLRIASLALWLWTRWMLLKYLI